MLGFDSLMEEFFSSNLTEQVVPWVFLLLLVDRLDMEPMMEDFAGRIGDAKSDGATSVGLKICGLSPISEIWGLGSSGGSGGLTII